MAAQVGGGTIGAAAMAVIEFNLMGNHRRVLADAMGMTAAMAECGCSKDQREKEKSHTAQPSPCDCSVHAYLCLHG